MACTVKELRVFLAGCDGDDVIGIDEGGLNLIVLANEEDVDRSKYTEFDNGNGKVLVSAYFEIGGITADGGNHPDGRMDNYHVACGNLPACQCGMALAEANCGCSGTKEEVAGYVKALKKVGWKTARAVEGPCPTTK